MFDQTSINRRQRQFEDKGKAERLKPPENIQPGASQYFGRLKIFRITGGWGTASGYVYNCIEQSVNVSTLPNWQLVDKNDTTVEVLDIANEGNLVLNDYLIGYPVIDNNGVRRYIGFSPKYAWWHA